MTVSEYKKSLAGEISEKEAAALRSGGSGLCISDFNRSVCLRLLDNECTDESSVSLADARELRKDLEDYLAEYMQDRPEGHKWIILACLQLTFVDRLPMHPQHAANWTEKDGRYYCSHMVPESITCRYCMCEPMPKE